MSIGSKHPLLVDEFVPVERQHVVDTEVGSGVECIEDTIVGKFVALVRIKADLKMASGVEHVGVMEGAVARHGGGRVGKRHEDVRTTISPSQSGSRHFSDRQAFGNSDRSTLLYSLRGFPFPTEVFMAQFALIFGTPPAISLSEELFATNWGNVIIVAFFGDSSFQVAKHELATWGPKHSTRSPSRFGFREDKMDVVLLKYRLHRNIDAKYYYNTIARW